MAPPVKATAAEVAELRERLIEMAQTVAELLLMVSDLKQKHIAQDTKLSIMEGRQAALQYRAQELTRG